MYCLSRQNCVQVLLHDSMHSLVLDIIMIHNYESLLFDERDKALAVEFVALKL